MEKKMNSIIQKVYDSPLRDIMRDPPQKQETYKVEMHKEELDETQIELAAALLAPETETEQEAE